MYKTKKYFFVPYFRQKVMNKTFIKDLIFENQEFVENESVIRHVNEENLENQWIASNVTDQHLPLSLSCHPTV